jgi:hypothetical protein
MTSFSYETTELPIITPAKAWNTTDEMGVVIRARYFNAEFPTPGTHWSFSSIDDDLGLDEIRRSILSWVAWYEFVQAGSLEAEIENAE